MRALVWLIRAALFVLLFAFALNNQHDAELNGFFGREWRAPMVLVVLAAFALGTLFGVLAMLPGWWRHRRAAQRAAALAEAAPIDSSVLPPQPDVPASAGDTGPLTLPSSPIGGSRRRAHTSGYVPPGPDGL